MGLMAILLEALYHALLRRCLVELGLSLDATLAAVYLCDRQYLQVTLDKSWAAYSGVSIRRRSLHMSSQ